MGTAHRDYPNARTTTGDFGISSVTGGLTVGHNEQFGDVVAGLEVDFSANSVTGSANRPNRNDVYKTENPWFTTFRPRLGYRFGSVMPYLTGGLAVGSERVSTYTRAGAPGSDFTRTELGWTAGTGLEVALSPSWSVKAEYLYVQLDRATGPVGPSVNSVDHFNEHIGRFGLNYKFDQPESSRPAYAPSSSQSSADEISLATTTGIELGGQISNYRYQEHVDPNTEFMHETGAKFGVTALATKAFHQGAFVSGDFRFAYSSNDYASAQGTLHHIPDYLFDIRLLVGKDFFLDRTLSLSPYVGIGYRNLYNDLRGTLSSGAKGYQRDSQYLYLPVGLTPRFRVTETARISTTLEYDQLVQGWQRSENSDASPSLSNVTNGQFGGYGLRGSVMYEQASWSVGPFFDYWNINKSDDRIVGARYYFEPHNQTIEYGLQARYRF